MINVPLIIVSSPKRKRGSSVLALNLAGALWNDNYQVGLYSSELQKVEKFLTARAEFSHSRKADIYQPKLIRNLQSLENVSAIVADISSDDYQQNEDMFNSAHTIITPLNSPDDVLWQADGEYLNFIWKIKKNQAAQGIMYLNWIVVPYLKNEGEADFSLSLSEQAKRFGFRLSPAIYYRDEYMHVENGYCSADLQKGNLAKIMTLKDVYARREILKLADFIWQKK